MPTNRFVESCFWNFDSLYVPQQHPARELQDTFYVKGALVPLSRSPFLQLSEHVLTPCFLPVRRAFRIDRLPARLL